MQSLPITVFTFLLVCKFLPIAHAESYSCVWADFTLRLASVTDQNLIIGEWVAPVPPPSPDGNSYKPSVLEFVSRAPVLKIAGSSHPPRFYLALGEIGLQIIDYRTIDIGAAFTYGLEPHETGYWSNGIPVLDVAARSNIVYLANDSAGLQILNCSDPAHPQLLGHADIANSARALSLSSNLVSVASAENKIHLFNISDPSAPQHLSEFTTAAPARALTIHSNYLFAAEGSVGVEIFDISNPALPALASAIQLPGNSVAIDVLDDPDRPRARVAASEAGVVILDLADPAYPIATRTNTTAGPSLSVARNWSSGPAGVESFVITEPVSIERIATVDMPNSGFIQNNLAFVSAGTNGLQIFNLADPRNPQLLSTYKKTNAFTVAISGSYAYMVNDFGPFEILDISDPTHPRQVSSLSGRFISSPVVHDSKAYLPQDFTVVDVSDPFIPQILSTTFFGADGALAFRGGTGIALDRAGYMSAFDPTPPFTMHQVADLSFVGGPEALVLKGNLAFAAGDYSLVCLDLSDPEHPRQLANYMKDENGWRGGGLAVIGNICFFSYAAAGAPLLVGFDITNPTNLPIVAQFNSTSDEFSYPLAFVAFGNLLLASTGNSRVVILDPGIPTLRLNQNDGALSLELQGRVGTTYSIEYKPNLASPWKVFTVVTLAQPSKSIFLTPETTATDRLFRARIVQ